VAKKKKNKQNHNKNRKVNKPAKSKQLTAIQILLFIPMLLTFAYLWTRSTFGNIGMEEIVFHLNMPERYSV